MRGIRGRRPTLNPAFGGGRIETLRDWDPLVADTADVEMLRSKARNIATSLSVGLGKVSSRFVADMLAGLLLSRSVRLSEIARALEEPIPEHSTHKRLSRNLGNARIGRVVGANLLEASARLIGTDTLLVVDAFELVKPYAERMEYLATLSVSPQPPKAGKGDRRKGYGVCEVFGWELGGGPMPEFAQLARSMPTQEADTPRRLSAWNDLIFTPVAQTLWSSEAPDFTGVTEQILGVVRHVQIACAGRGVFAINATTHPDLPAALAAAPCRYLAWVPDDYPLLHRRRETSAAAVGQECRTPYGTTVYKPRTDVDHGVFIHFGATPVRLPTQPERPLWLLVLKAGFGGHDAYSVLHLLTTEPMRRSREVLWQPVWSFMHYQDALHTNQQIKRRFDFSDVRVLNYQRLRNLAILVQAAAFAEAQWPGIALRESVFLKPRTGTPVVFPKPVPDSADSAVPP